ncbi:hypothetical protein DFH09DRAFT_1089435 [Mycena vulgaris]|nr:hypothetical protein DFH09DRAFT_1089435 [Mycena vulgaris]
MHHKLTERDDNAHPRQPRGAHTGVTHPTRRAYERATDSRHLDGLSGGMRETMMETAGVDSGGKWGQGRERGSAGLGGMMVEEGETESGGSEGIQMDCHRRHQVPTFTGGSHRRHGNVTQHGKEPQGAGAIGWHGGNMSQKTDSDSARMQLQQNTGTELGILRDLCQHSIEQEA